MKITAKWIVDDQSDEVKKAVDKASKGALSDTIIDIAEDTIKGSPWLTGNNARSIMFEVGPGGEVAKSSDEGAVYSTSGYGGFLETGSKGRPARPYFRPALDKHIHKLAGKIKTKLETL